MYERQVELGEEHLSEAEFAAKNILRELGFAVEEVPRGNSKTPDFLVDGDSPGYVVEVASRFLSEKIADEALTITQQKDPKVGEWLSEACKQCAAVDPGHDRLWFVWGSAEGPIGAESQFERIINALYGIRTYLDLDAPEVGRLRAYYGRPPLLARHPKIDAVFVYADDIGLALCPNEFSDRFEAVRNSKLVQQMKTVLNVPFVLVDERARDQGCVVPAAVDRNSEGDVLKFVQKTLGRRKLTPLHDVHYVDVLRIPKEQVGS